ncbi:TonB-dependent receptor [bacterium]|nr:TonB-dependent receptor [bacterium]
MKSKIFATLLSAIVFANLPVNAIDELTDMRDDGKEAEVKKVLYGQLSDKQVFSLNNYASDAATSGASVDVITREDIKGQNTPFVSTLLNQLGSVTYGQGSGGMGQPSKLIMRGSDRVMFTVDGVRIDTITGTARTTNLSNFLLSDDYERIEVVRGSQGTIAGHTASGGMVAMQTRRGSGRLKTEAESLFGSYGYFKERFAVMGGNEKYDHYTAATWFKTDDGTWLEDNGRRGDNTFNNLNLVGNYGVRFLDGKAELRDVIRYSRGRKNLGMNIYSYGLQDFDYANTQDLTNALTWTHNVNKYYDYDIKASVYNSNYDMHYNPGFQYDAWNGLNIDRSHSRTNQNGTRFDVGTQHNINVTDWNRLSVGYNFEVENFRLQSAGLSDWGAWFGMVPESNYERAHTLQHDVFVQDSINIKDKLFIRGGARMMSNSKYGTWVTPNASAALVLPTFKIDGAKTTFRGSWGMNVNTPTLYQRFGDGGTYVLANQDLDPERVNSWDAGINQSLFHDKLSIDFGYFNSSYKDFINYNGGWPGAYVNIGRVKMQGYEGRLTWKPTDKVKVIFNYTYTDAEDKDNHRQVDLVSNNRINGTIVWSPVERFQAYIGVEGGTERTVANGAYKLPGYIDVNLGTLVRLFSWKDAHFYLQGDMYNLLNQKIACGYYGNGSRVFRPGINFRLGLFVKYALPEKTKEKV